MDITTNISNTGHRYYIYQQHITIIRNHRHYQNIVKAAHHLLYILCPRSIFCSRITLIVVVQKEEMIGVFGQILHCKAILSRGQLGLMR